MKTFLKDNQKTAIQAEGLINEWKIRWQKKYQILPIVIGPTAKRSMMKSILRQCSYEYAVKVLDIFFESRHFSALRNKHLLDDFYYNFNVFQVEMVKKNNLEWMNAIMTDRIRTILRNGKIWTQAWQEGDWSDDGGKRISDVNMREFLKGEI